MRAWPLVAAVLVLGSGAAVQAGDSAPWDLQALCAAESEAETLRIWRDQQTKAGRLSSAQSDAVLQVIAVVYLEFDGRGLPDALQQDGRNLDWRSLTR